MGKPVLIYFSLKQPGRSDEEGTPDERFPALGAVHVRKLGKGSWRIDLENGQTDVARWDRTFRVVR